MVFNGNTERKMEQTIENWCQIVCGILFDLICCMTSSARQLKQPKVISFNAQEPKFFIIDLLLLTFLSTQRYLLLSQRLNVLDFYIMANCITN